MVGEFNFTVQVGNDSQSIPTVLLFNPWCKGDEGFFFKKIYFHRINFFNLVYYPKTSDLDEYILNDEGYVWVGKNIFFE